jgi:hypothetical protein
MAISVVHSSSAIENTAGGTSVTSSPTWTSTSANLLVAVASYWSGSSINFAATPLADGGTNTWAQTASSEIGGSGNFVRALIGYAANCVGKAAQSVTATITASQFPSTALIEASGCKTASPQDFTPTFASGGTSPLITPAAGDHLLVVVGTTDSGSPNQGVTNAGTGSATWTVIKNDSGAGQPIMLAYAIVTADGSHTYGVTYTGISNDSVVGITSFAAATGGPSPQTVNPGFIATAESLYQPTVNRQVLPGTIASAAALYQPTVTLSPLPGQVNPNAIATAEAVFSPAVTLQTPQTVNPGTIGTAESVYAPSLNPTGRGALSITLPTSYVYQAISSGLPSSQPVTLALWARMDAITNQGELLCVLDAAVTAAEGIWSKYTNLSDGGTAWEMASIIGGDATVYTPNTVLGSWHYLAFTINTSGLFTGYYDGVSQGTNTLVGTMTPAYIALGIPVSGNSIVGAVCHARCWAAVLTQAEIAAEMTQGAAVRTANLYADWPLNSDLLDISGHGNTLVHDAGGSNVFVPSDPLTKTVNPGFITTAESVYAPTVSQQVLPNTIGTAAAVYMPTLSMAFPAQVFPNAIPSAAVVFNLTVLATRQAFPDAIPSAAVVYGPTVATVTPQTVTPDTIASGAVVFGPAFAGPTNILQIAPDGVASAAAVYAPTVNRIRHVTPPLELGVADLAPLLVFGPSVQTPVLSPGVRPNVPPLGPG